MGATGSITKSMRTISTAPEMAAEILLFLNNASPIAPVIKLSITQLAPIRMGTPRILTPRFSPYEYDPKINPKLTPKISTSIPRLKAKIAAHAIRRSGFLRLTNNNTSVKNKLMGVVCKKNSLLPYKIPRHHLCETTKSSTQIFVWCALLELEVLSWTFN